MSGRIQSMLKKEQLIKINPLFDAAKLREFTSSFKRHTIKRMIRPREQLPRNGSRTVTDRLRQSPSDYFQIYCRQVIPQIESRMEERLLTQFLNEISSPEERQEVIFAYHQRRQNLAKLAEEEDLSRPDDRKPPNQMGLDRLGAVIQNAEGEGLTYHNYSDIGRYTVFPDKQFKRMFPRKPFGTIEQDDYSRNQTYGIMTREEGLRITNELHRLTLPSERKVEFNKIATLPSKEVKNNFIQNEQEYLAIQQDFCIDLLNYIDSLYGQTQVDVKQFFAHPGVFDGFVSIMIQELRQKPIRPHLCDTAARKLFIAQFVTKVMTGLKEIKVRTFAEVCEHLPILKFKLPKSNLATLSELQAHDVVDYKLYLQGYHKFCYHHWRPEDIRNVSLNRFKGNNTGCLLWGDRGCGKSQILTYVTAWAHENNWVNFTISDPEAFIGGKTELFRFKNGLYLQKDLAKSLLEDFRHSNEQTLSEFQVNMSIYGTYDISGIKDGEPEPCPRVWDPLRQVWSDSWKEQLYDIEIKNLQAKYESMNFRLSDRLSDPKTLMQIVDEGIANPDLATNAIAEILEQLYKSDQHQTLITVDNYNQWFMPTKFPSFRYSNDKNLRGHIPPHDLALCRLFMKFDGHFMRNGVKMLATSHHKQFNHICKPEDIHFYEGYHNRVDNLKLNDFRNAMHYFTLTEWTNDSYDKEWELENLFMETQGNWYAFKQSFTKAMRVYY